MSLSLHSSMDALTSSKRGLEKDRLIEPEKSSIGEISPRISSSPDWAVSSAATRARQASLPTSQSNDCGHGCRGHPSVPVADTPEQRRLSGGVYTPRLHWVRSKGASRPPVSQASGRSVAAFSARTDPIGHTRSILEISHRPCTNVSVTRTLIGSRSGFVAGCWVFVIVCWPSTSTVACLPSSVTEVMPDDPTSPWTTDFSFSACALIVVLIDLWYSSRNGSARYAAAAAVSWSMWR